MTDNSSADDQRDGSIARRTAVLGAIAGAGALAVGLAQAAPAAATVPATPSATGDLLVTLGTVAGPVVVPNTYGISTLLRSNGALYLIDCGRGSISQFANLGFNYLDLKSMLITHLHSDHIFDYYNYFMSLGEGISYPDAPVPIQVYGPGPAGGLPPSRVGQPETFIEPLTPGIVETTDLLHQAYAYTSNIQNRAKGAYDIRGLSVTNEIPTPAGADYLNTAPVMEPFEVFSDENVTVSAILVPHYDVFPSYAFRFETAAGKSITFSGDTIKSANVVKLAAGSDFLVHGSIFQPVGDYLVRSHASAVDVGQVARDAGVKNLVVSHHNQAVSGTTDAQWFAAIGQNYSGPVSIAKDGQYFAL